MHQAAYSAIREEKFNIFEQITPTSSNLVKLSLCLSRTSSLLTFNGRRRLYLLR